MSGEAKDALVSLAVYAVAVVVVTGAIVFGFTTLQARSVGFDGQSTPTGLEGVR